MLLTKIYVWENTMEYNKYREALKKRSELSPASIKNMADNLLTIHKNTGIVKLHKSKNFFYLNTRSGVGVEYSADALVDVPMLINEFAYYKEYFMQSNLLMYIQRRYGLLVSVIPYHLIKNSKCYTTNVLMLLNLRKSQGQHVSNFIAFSSERYIPMMPKKLGSTALTKASLDTQAYYGDIYDLNDIKESLSSIDIEKFEYQGIVTKCHQALVSSRASNNLIYQHTPLDNLYNNPDMFNPTLELQLQFKKVAMPLHVFNKAYMQHIQKQLPYTATTFVTGGYDLPEKLLQPAIVKALEYLAPFNAFLRTETKIVADPTLFDSVNLEKDTILESCRGHVDIASTHALTEVTNRFSRSSKKNINNYPATVDPYFERSIVQNKLLTPLCVFNAQIVNNHYEAGDSRDDVEYDIDFNITKAFSNYLLSIKGTARYDAAVHMNAYPRSVWETHINKLTQIIQDHPDNFPVTTTQAMSDMFLPLAEYKLQHRLAKLASNLLREIPFREESYLYLLRATVEKSRGIYDRTTDTTALNEQLFTTAQILVSLALTKRVAQTSQKVVQSSVAQLNPRVFKHFWKNNVTPVPKSRIFNVVGINWVIAKSKLDATYPMYFSLLSSKALSIIASHHDCVENRVTGALYSDTYLLSPSSNLDPMDFMTHIVQPESDGRLGMLFGNYITRKPKAKNINIVSTDYYAWFNNKYNTNLNKMKILHINDTVTDLSLLLPNVRSVASFGNLEARKQAHATTIAKKEIQASIVKETKDYMYIKEALESERLTTEDKKRYIESLTDKSKVLISLRNQLSDLDKSADLKKAKEYVAASHNYAEAVTNITKHSMNEALINILPKEEVKTINKNWVSEPLVHVLRMGIRGVTGYDGAKLIKDGQAAGESDETIVSKRLEMFMECRDNMTKVTNGLLLSMPALAGDYETIMDVIMTAEDGGITSTKVQEALESTLMTPLAYSQRIVALGAQSSIGTASALEESMELGAQLMKHFSYGHMMNSETTYYDLGRMEGLVKAVKAVDSDLSCKAKH